MCAAIERELNDVYLNQLLSPQISSHTSLPLGTPFTPFSPESGLPSLLTERNTAAERGSRRVLKDLENQVEALASNKPSPC